MNLRHISSFGILGLIVIFLLIDFPNAEGRVVADEPVEGKETREEKWGCVACATVTGLMSQLMEVHKTDANGAMGIFCGLFPLGESVICQLARYFLWEKALPLLNNKESPDVVCQAMGYCFNPTCHLFPLKNDGKKVADHVHRLRVQNQPLRREKIDMCTFFPSLCRSIDDHVALEDKDGDLFSTIPEFRGTVWRGRDCDDKSPTTFPGRAALDAFTDENCNGIYGVDSETGKTYEEMWCSGDYKGMGIIALGDSATAHFGIPGDLLNITKLSRASAKHIAYIIENEFDWPMLSYFTGFEDANKFAPNRAGVTKSVYSEFLKRNRCNHRDFQNLGVNGASTRALSSMMDVVTRNRTSNVKPVLMFIAMIGNDVCDFPSTTPDAYYNNIMKALDKANDRLPEGSHVVIIPVADGRMLYNVMHNRTHPIGSLHGDVTYENFYDFLNCLDVSPCPRWLTTNGTVRENTYKTVQTLNAQIPRIIESSRKKYNAIKVHYIGNPIEEMLQIYKGDKWDLIEPVDGFHPSQLANSLIGEYVAKKIISKGFAPPINPFNDAIQKRFGDQGGY